MNTNRQYPMIACDACDGQSHAAKTAALRKELEDMGAAPANKAHFVEVARELEAILPCTRCNGTGQIPERWPIREAIASEESKRVKDRTRISELYAQLRECEAKTVRVG